MVSDRKPGATVLVVDDEDDVRQCIAHVLAVEGYQGLTAMNGEDALVLARTLEGRLPLVVTDLRRPEMGGLVLAARDRAFPVALR